MNSLLDKAVIIIPTLNAGGTFDPLLAALSHAGVPPARVLVVDSSSSDDTAARAAAFVARVKVIPKSEFNHGGTRKLGVALCPDAAFCIFLTQDALPATQHTFENVMQPFVDEGIGLIYGRQLPRPAAREIERYARLTNYGAHSYVRSFEDRKTFGIRTPFCSNSFAAYRRSALEAVGNFPDDSYFGEDQTVAARMLTAGWKLGYAADAEVYHSHDYSIAEDFRRYFDIGVFHCDNAWITKNFGKPEGEGARMALREIVHLARLEPLSVPSAAIRSLAKLAAYKLGLRHQKMSLSWKARLGMHGFYWRSRETASKRTKTTAA
jgi:rhamnosyltransferase